VDLTSLNLTNSRIPSSALSLIPCHNLRRLKCHVVDDVGAHSLPSSLRSISCPKGFLLHPSILPSALTTLQCSAPYLDSSLPHLPATLTDLRLKVRESSELHDWPTSLPRNLVNLALTIPRGELQADGLNWPEHLLHISLSGFVASARFWSFPTSLRSLKIERSRLLEAELVLSRLPKSLTSFCMHELKIIDEDIQLLPPNLVTLKAHMELSDDSFPLLPKTLRHVGSFRKPLDPRVMDLVPEHCFLAGPRLW
jgi:hypothetical protein